jgi:hypothetical protein
MIAASADCGRKREALFAVLATAEYGTLFPHDALLETCEEAEKRGRYAILMRQVTRRLEQEAGRTLETVRGVGYRVAMPAHHLSLAHKRHTRSVRQKRIALHILEATNETQLTLEERRRLDDARLLYRKHLTDMRKIKVRVKKEHAITETLLDSRIAKLEASLGRIEAMTK